jgi:hypothetical protein
LSMNSSKPDRLSQQWATERGSAGKAVQLPLHTEVEYMSLI